MDGIFNRPPDRAELIEMGVALWAALEYRDNCPNCGGKGWDYVGVGEDLDKEPCDCSRIAQEAIEKFNGRYIQAVDEFIRTHLLERKKLEATYDKLSYPLMELIIRGTEP